MKRIPIFKSEGAVQDSIIKLNYLFTITNDVVLKTVFHLSVENKRMILKDIMKKLEGLRT